MTTKLKFRDTDAALIFRRDGFVEVLIPHDGNGPPSASNVFITQALLWASQDARMMKTIADAFTAAFESEPPMH